MKLLLKYVLLLICFEILIVIAGSLLISTFGLDLSFSDIALLSLGYTFIALITIIVFFRGQTKDAGSQTMHTLVSLSLKFLIEMVLAVIWFLIAKKTELRYVILFFVLYLAFTLFSVILMLKTLKNKSL